MVFRQFNINEWHDVTMFLPLCRVNHNTSHVNFLKCPVSLIFLVITIRVDLGFLREARRRCRDGNNFKYVPRSPGDNHPKGRAFPIKYSQKTPTQINERTVSSNHIEIWEQAPPAAHNSKYNTDLERHVCLCAKIKSSFIRSNPSKYLAIHATKRSFIIKAKVVFHLIGPRTKATKCLCNKLPTEILCFGT